MNHRTYSGHRFFSFSLLLSCSLALSAQERIQGAGATFPKPLYDAWFDAFNAKHRVPPLRYDGGGSGVGIEKFKTDETITFAGSDWPVRADDLANARLSSRTVAIQIPTAVGAIVPVYNLPGLEDPLNFTCTTLAGIFSGQIKRWDDQKILASNDPLKAILSRQGEITIVYRDEKQGSGSTRILLEYLAECDAKTGHILHRKMVPDFKWPKSWIHSGALGATGNAGVSDIVGKNKGAIGYVEWFYASEKRLSVGWVQNRKNRFVAANRLNITYGFEDKSNDVLRLDPVEVAKRPFDTKASDAYPISAMTWLLLPKSQLSVEFGARLGTFFCWMMEDPDAREIESRFGYGSLSVGMKKYVCDRLKGSGLYDGQACAICDR